MKARNAMIVFRKDWLDIKRNWQIIAPVIILPIIISLLLPIIIIGASSADPSSSGDLETLISGLPPGIQQELEGLSPAQIALYMMALYFFAPFFLIIPIMTSSVIASDSFAGEKERKTIEALLATPLTDGELFLGKVLVAFIPSMAATIASFAIYSAVIDIYSLQVVGSLILPNLTWILLIFGLAPTVALLGIGLTVLISAKVRGFREAQQISAILVLPIIALIFGQLSGTITFGSSFVATLIAGFVLADLLVFFLSIKRFNREEILSKV